MVKKPRLFIALCTLPALILTIVFMIVPMVNAIYLSFTSSTALSVGFNSKFVFLDNYKYMFQDKDFLQALSKSCICIYPYSGTAQGKVILPDRILFPKYCFHDCSWYCVVFCV